MSDTNHKQFSPGAIVDNQYEVIEYLGNNRMASVYSARHVHSAREVALKMMHNVEFVGGSEDAEIFQERFNREARAAASVMHPNIAAFFDAGYVNDRLYTTMELLKGHDLKEELREHGPISPARAKRLFVPCLFGLGAAHKHSIVHRELNTENLFISQPETEEELLKLFDFGMALLDDGEMQKRLTKPDQVIGTPAYTSPEALTENKSTPARDVYAMGLLLVEALSGRTVVEGENMFECMDLHCNQKLEIPSWILHSPFGPSLARALAFKDTDRFVNASAFAAALSALDDAAVAQIEVPANPAGDLMPLIEYEPPELPPQEFVKPKPKPDFVDFDDDDEDLSDLLDTGRKPLMLYVAVLGGAALIGVLIVLLFL